MAGLIIFGVYGQQRTVGLGRKMPVKKRTQVIASASPAETPATPRKKVKKGGGAFTSMLITPALKAKASKIAGQLQQLYPKPAIPLDHSSHFQLLVAVILSAQVSPSRSLLLLDGTMARQWPDCPGLPCIQSTDVKVNQVTPALFCKAPDAHAMAQLASSAIEVSHHIQHQVPMSLGGH